MRLSLLLVILGMLIEISVIVNSFALKQDWQGWIGKLSYTEAHRLYILNSIGGFLGSLLLIYGAISFSSKLRVSRGALRWLFLCGVFFVTAKAFDVIDTIWNDYMDALLGAFPYTDQLVMNVLFVSSALALLSGMICALKDLHRSNTILELQNRQLDSEMRAHQKASEQAHAREAELTTILNALNSPVFLTDREGTVLAHNAAFAGVFGDPEHSLAGVYLRTLFFGEAYEKGKERALEALDQIKADTLRFTINDRVYDINIYPVQDKSGISNRVTVLARDITDKLKAEQEQRLLEAAVNSAAECITVLNQEGLIEYVNPAFEAQTGYSRDEVVGRNLHFLDSDAQGEAFYEHLSRVIQEKGVWRGRLTRKGKSGAVFYQAATVSPIVNETGEITHYIIVGRDITHELKMEEQLQQARMLQALGVFAGGVAHDLNNTLAIILGRSEIALQLLDENHPIRQYLEVITRNGNRSVELIKRLLTFARQKTGVSGPLYAVPLLQAQLERLRAGLPGNIRVKDRIDLECDVITVDPASFESMVDGLVDNARRAMQPDGGDLDISLENVRIETKKNVATGILEPGRYVLLRVSDTGCGMDAKVRRRIFEPFYTTRNMEEGVGLALSEVYGNVLEAGGQIDVESAPAHGTRMNVYWPRATGGDTAPVPAARAISGAGISVLLIDDAEDFVTMMKMELVQNGFKVVSFDDPETALGHVGEDPVSIDIAVVDYSMPGMNGVDLARALHGVRPNLPVVLLTGYASAAITRDTAQQQGFDAVVEKPVRMGVLPDLLTRLVREN